MDFNGILRIIDKEMVPALGCTDPAGVAYAAAYSKKYGKGKILSIEAELSANVIKNAFAVAIPNTNGRCGITLALALGATVGKEEKKLEVFSDITEEGIKEADRLIASKKVHVSAADNDKKLFIRVSLQTEEAQVEVVIEDTYTNVTSLSINGKEHLLLLEPLKSNGNEEELPYYYLSLKSILDFSVRVPIDKLERIQQAVDLNMDIAKKGMEGGYGISVGRNIQNAVRRGTMCEDYSTIAMMWTAAATDARMAGLSYPVISNTGSGNQGLASTIPIIAIAEKREESYEKLIRAVTISSLVTILIKHKLGVLSAVCGATIASTGVACGLVYLMGGSEKDMLTAMKSVVGNVVGMVCDGAKAGCSMKVATCTQAAVLAALMAIEGFGIQGTDGIVDDSEEKTIDNLIKLATSGMEKVDQVLLDIILEK